MKILMLTPYLPFPPSSGGQVRSYNLIKNLAQKHEITLFSLIKKEEEKKYVLELEKYCKKVKVFKRSPRPWTLRNILKTGFSSYPFLVIRNSSDEEKEALINELNGNLFDLIHAETFYVMPHLPETKTPILLVDQTIEFQVYQHFVEKSKLFFLKPLLYLDVLKIRYWELKFWKKANKVVAVSEADKQKMLYLEKNLDVGVVPNGAGEDLMKIGNFSKNIKEPVILFQANFSWLQNIEAAANLAKKVFPLIKKTIPQAKCRIVGQGAREKLKKLSSEDVQIVDLETDDTEGVMKAYRQASVFVAPLEGPGGTRLKILGAMAASVPVITTTVGIEGIDAHNNKEVLIADSWSLMAKNSIKLIRNPDFYRRMTSSARKLIEDKYSYQKISLILDKFYREVAGGRKN
ncbi:MAG: Glycosyl transferases group 1 [Microgenomates group bacterium ADurb.Bin219]|nr:MAG: Glycosyl transferases group 1 [Microgenomates group bacterium ADurb.Bin219]HNP89675.1 glycosyltransferase family 4 protein [Candidatus Woesebacteria bacterium]